MADLFDFFRSIGFGAIKFYFSFHCAKDFVIQKFSPTDDWRLFTAFMGELAKI